MQNEIAELNANHIWEFVDLPPDVVSIGSRWVKRHAKGSIERSKARLVAQGFNQTEGLDYLKPSHLLAKLSTVIVLLALAAIHGWHLHQLDVNNAFMHGDLHEAGCMKVPQGVFLLPNLAKFVSYLSLHTGLNRLVVNGLRSLLNFYMKWKKVTRKGSLKCAPFKIYYLFGSMSTVNLMSQCQLQHNIKKLHFVASLQSYI